MSVSHFHQGYDRGVDRGTFTAAGRAYYGRPVDATTIPDISTYDLVQTAAEAIIQGEADRQSNESPHVAMALPSAAEIQALHYTFLLERNLAQLAETRTDTQREEAQVMYPEAQLSPSISATP